MTDSEILDKIETIQQDWWDGVVPINVAMSEIRSWFRERERKID